jgi:hypothetical protein
MGGDPTSSENFELFASRGLGVPPSVPRGTVGTPPSRKGRFCVSSMLRSKGASTAGGSQGHRRANAVGDHSTQHSLSSAVFPPQLDDNWPAGASCTALGRGFATVGRARLPMTNSREGTKSARTRLGIPRQAAKNISTTAVASIEAPVGSGDEAELVSLGEQLVLLLKQWLPLRAEADARGTQAHDQAWAMAGVDPDNRRQREDIDRFLLHLKRTRSTTGLAKIEEKAEAIAKAIDAVQKRIMVLPAHSVAGFRAKALVAMYCHIDHWVLTDIEDTHESAVLRGLIEAFGGPIPELLRLWKDAKTAALAAAEIREEVSATRH